MRAIRSRKTPMATGMTGSCLLIAAILLAAALPSRAGDVRLVLTGERSIDGSIVDSNEAAYVVETAHGTVTVFRGDVIRITDTEPKGDGLGLNDKTEVKVIAPAGKALPESWES